MGPMFCQTRFDAMVAPHINLSPCVSNFSDVLPLVSVGLSISSHLGSNTSEWVARHFEGTLANSCRVS